MTPTPTVARLWQRIRADWLLLALAGALPVLLLAAPGPDMNQLAGLHRLVHWDTIGALAGLMVLSRALEDSGYLFRAGRWLLARVHGERTLAAVLVLFSAGLSALVTNDVTLFIVVPLTLGLSSVAHLPIGRLVIFEALAVNAGSALSPIGNPQNLFLWQQAGVSFLEFTVAMAPLSTALLLMLLAVIPFAFSGGPITFVERMPAAAERRRLFLLTLALYPLFLASVELGFTVPATFALIVLYALVARGVLAGVDWLLLVVFVLMFADLGLLAGIPAVAELAVRHELAPGGLLTTGILLSQAISNVPAAIFLAGFTDDWRTLAWAVSVGGFGFALGSMANLIALRLAREPGLWRAFHAWALPALAAGWLIAWLMLAGPLAGLA
ncbi:MAG: hypothetical protein KF911_08480 [Pseudomonadales bacterium]|nr:hypothetical protein [Pseudomonadales bacterium]